MADRIQDVRRWLEQFPPDWKLWIGHGGVALVAASPNRQIIETRDLGDEHFEEINNASKTN